MKSSKVAAVLTALVAVFAVSPAAQAASQPNLNSATTFSVLSSSYINTATGTTLNGDLGYSTPPAVMPTVSGATHVANAVYNQAGIDQATALAAINGEPCTYTFPVGAIDLASDTSRGGTTGEFTPGVYCIDGAASIGGGGTITLSGSGVFIFRSTGALNTSANSKMVATGGASACSAVWAPGAAATLGANSTFMGTIIDPAGITIGSTVAWTGRALAFGGTVTSETDTINTVPQCAAASTSTATAAAAASIPKTPGLPNSGLATPSAATLPAWSIPAAIASMLTGAFFLRRFI
ncbi:MAG TPA: ice-binding family protein [Candidatus Saccharimonadales bacterium]|jgi:hypothetical protein